MPNNNNREVFSFHTATEAVSLTVSSSLSLSKPARIVYLNIIFAVVLLELACGKNELLFFILPSFTPPIDEARSQDPSCSQIRQVGVLLLSDNFFASYLHNP